MHPQVHPMMTFYTGFSDAYGVCNLKKGKREDGKQEYNAATKHGKLTVQHWEDHLNGKQGLGIIPIDEHNEVHFAIIDIDIYPIDPRPILEAIKEHKLPFIPIRTKSGGIHLTIFFKEPMKAKEVVAKLRDIAAFLGYGDCEIFPKQTEILVDRGDIGVWINMPYFDSEQTMRYAYTEGGNAMSIKSFISHVSQIQCTPEQFRAIKLEAKNEIALPGAPPCLNMLINLGFPSGTRNKGLFNLGVYAMKADEDGWEKKLEELNQKYMKPPLGANEVLGVVKSLKKKEYNYTCKDEPICGHCHSAKCRACEFGVGTGAGLPVMGSLSKLCTDPPIWFLEIENSGKLELTTEDLQQPLKFQKVCMEVLNIMPTVIKREVWHSIVQDLIKEVNLIPVPEDVKPSGMLMEHLEKFCSTRMISEDRKSVLSGKPFKEKGKIHFRMQDFIAYLDRVKFNQITSTSKICSVLRKNNCKHGQFNIDRKCVQTWSVPEFVEQVDKYEAPLQDDGDNY